MTNRMLNFQHVFEVGFEMYVGMDEWFSTDCCNHQQGHIGNAQDLTKTFHFPLSMCKLFIHLNILSHASSWSKPFIDHPHKLVRATNERFLPAWVTFRVGSTTSCNQCWHSPFTGGSHQYVWVGYHPSLSELKFSLSSKEKLTKRLYTNISSSTTS